MTTKKCDVTCFVPTENKLDLFILKQYLFGQLSIETYVGLKWVMGQQKLSETKIISYNNGSHLLRHYR